MTSLAYNLLSRKITFERYQQNKTAQEIIIPDSKPNCRATSSPIIKNIFSIDGVAAPAQKFPLVFKLAENKAVKTINIRYGKTILYKVWLILAFLNFQQNPGL